MTSAFSHVASTKPEHTAKSKSMDFPCSIYAHAVRRSTVWIYATLGQRFRVQRMQNGRIKGFLSVGYALTIDFNHLNDGILGEQAIVF